MRKDGILLKLLPMAIFASGCSLNLFPSGGSSAAPTPTPGGPTQAVVPMNYALELNTQIAASADGTFRVRYPESWIVKQERANSITLAPKSNALNTVVMVESNGNTTPNWAESTLGANWEATYKKESDGAQELYTPVFGDTNQERLAGTMWKIIESSLYKVEFSVDNKVDYQPTLLQIESMARSIEKLR